MHLSLSNCFKVFSKWVYKSWSCHCVFSSPVLGHMLIWRKVMTWLQESKPQRGSSGESCTSGASLECMTCASHLWLCGHIVAVFLAWIHMWVVCVWQSIQISSWQMHINTAGWTHKDTSRWVKISPKGCLCVENCPRSSLWWTPFKCFYCHFCCTSQFWWGHCVWHFLWDAKLKGHILYHPAVLCNQPPCKSHRNI